MTVHPPSQPRTAHVTGKPDACERGSAEVWERNDHYLVVSFPRFGVVVPWHHRVAQPVAVDRC